MVAPPVELWVTCWYTVSAFITEMLVIWLWVSLVLLDYIDGGATGGTLGDLLVHRFRIHY